tara:strand:+ start:369 stop:509 length:141 start_codon:yes stop_codon:yes gene_type:complete
MIKNIIIISLIFVIYTGMTAPEALEWVSMGLDKLQDLVYNVKSEVN